MLAVEQRGELHDLRQLPAIGGRLHDRDRLPVATSLERHLDRADLLLEEGDEIAPVHLGARLRGDAHDLDLPLGRLALLVPTLDLAPALGAHLQPGQVQGQLPHLPREPPDLVLLALLGGGDEGLRHPAQLLAGLLPRAVDLGPLLGVPALEPGDPRCLGHLLGHLPELHVELDHLPGPPDGHDDPVARLLLAQGPEQVRHPLEPDLADPQQDVAALETGQRRGALGNDAVDHHSAVPIALQLLGLSLGKVPDLDSHPAPRLLLGECRGGRKQDDDRQRDGETRDPRRCHDSSPLD